jgi:glycosyltransferase involved in cell wall biosynthesis
MREKVLYVVNLNPSQKFGSMEEQIFLLSSTFAREGGLLLPVFIEPIGEKQGLRYQEAGLKTASLDLREFSLSKFVQLTRLIDFHRMTVVHWNMYPPANSYVTLLRLFRPALKHFLTDHNSRPIQRARPIRGLKRLCKKAFISAYSKVFAISEFVLSDLKEQSVWNNLMRYHHFVNTNRFQPSELARSQMRNAQTSENAFVMLVVAHLIQEKGVDVAIRALEKLPPNVALWVVGDGPERMPLERLAESLGVSHRTSFFGLHSEVCPFMQAADCLVCPSVWKEAAGLVLLEAMACGLPLIGSSIGAIPEFIAADQTGFLFPAGDHIALANRVNQLRVSPARQQEMRAQSRAQALSHHSHQIGIPQAIALYDTAH